jgi:hypothetical protein
MEYPDHHDEYTIKFIDYLNRRKDFSKNMKVASPIENFLKNTDLKLYDEEKHSEVDNPVRRKGHDEFLKEISAIKTIVYQRISSKFKEELEKKFANLVRMFNENDDVENEDLKPVRGGRFR